MEATPRITTPATARLIRVGLWTLVVFGALGGVAGALRPAPTAAHHASPHQEPAPAGLAGVAQLAVRDWLNTTGRGLQRGATTDEPVDVVDSVTTYDKGALAERAAEVFRPDVEGRLALVTCADWNGEIYLSNVVVIATAPRPLRR